MNSAAMKILPKQKPSDTVTFEFAEREFTIAGEVDRSGHVHEAHVWIAGLDGVGQDPLDCTEGVRKSKYYMALIQDFVSTYDWISRELEMRYAGWDKT